jgi:hypothetical protein
MSEETDDEIAEKVLMESLSRVRDSNPAPSAQREEKTIEELEEKLAVAVKALERIVGVASEPTHGPFSMGNIQCVARTALEVINKND